MSQPLKLGFVGTGFMGQAVHLPNFSASEQCEIVALADLKERQAELVARRHQIGRVCASHEEIAADPEIEACVAIASEAFNQRIACDLLEAGKHVFIEKPMSRSVAGGRAMVEAAERSGKLLMVGYMKRYDEGVLAAKQLLDELQESGELGDVSFVRAHCFGGDWICGQVDIIQTDEQPQGFEPTPTPDWLTEENARKFLTFSNVFCHNLNLLRFLLGDKLTPITASLAHEKSWPVTFDGGGYPISLEVGSLPAYAWDEHTTIYFDRGWLHIETPPPLVRAPARVSLYKGGQTHEIHQPLAPWSWAFRNEAEHFLECIAKGSEPRSSGADSLQDLEIAEQILRIRQKGGTS